MARLSTASTLIAPIASGWHSALAVSSWLCSRFINGPCTDAFLYAELLAEPEIMDFLGSVASTAPGGLGRENTARAVGYALAGWGNARMAPVEIPPSTSRVCPVM
jgi:hypothetical protein